MSKFEVGQNVLVPAASLSKVPQGETHALVERIVHEVVERSVRVDTSGGDSELVASSQVHAAFDLVLLSMGDFRSEPTLIGPIRESLQAFFGLLMPTDRFKVWPIRTKIELADRMEHEGLPSTHIVMVGHCDGNSLLLAANESLSGAQFGQLLLDGGGVPKTVVSLACKSGRAGFGKALSQSGGCAGVLAPFNDIHGAAAVLMAATYFTELLLNGTQSATARKRARAALPPPAPLSWWRDGTKLAV